MEVGTIWGWSGTIENIVMYTNKILFLKKTANAVSLFSIPGPVKTGPVLQRQSHQP